MQYTIVICTTHCDCDKHISSGPTFSNKRYRDGGESLCGQAFVNNQAGLGKIDEAVDCSCSLAAASSPKKQATHQKQQVPMQTAVACWRMKKRKESHSEQSHIRMSAILWQEACACGINQE